MASELSEVDIVGLIDGELFGHALQQLLHLIIVETLCLLLVLLGYGEKRNGVRINVIVIGADGKNCVLLNSRLCGLLRKIDRETEFPGGEQLPSLRMRDCGFGSAQ